MLFKNTPYSAIGGRRDWRPGLQRLPLVGISALMVSFAGIFLSVAILLGSNGRQINSWKFQPTVYLSIASTMTNISLSTALVEGISIAWWNKSMKGGTTVADLHRVWDFGKSFWSSITAGRHFNTVALACILVALTPINGPLLQRASHVGSQNRTSYPVLDIGISPQLSHSWPTGIITGRQEVVQVLTNNFSPTVQDFNNQKAISFSSGCNSTCLTKIRGSGFRASCSDHTVPYNFSIGTDTIGQESLIFSSGVTYDVYRSDPATCSIDLLFKPSPGCLGTYTVRSCALQVGLMEYPVVIDGRTSSISLQPQTTIWDDITVGDTYNISSESLYDTNSTYGGIYLALSNKFTDRLTMSWEGAVGWTFGDISGQTGNAFLQLGNEVVGDNNCTVHMEDPTESILQSARDLMFRAAIAASNVSTIQRVQVEQLIDETIYTSSYLFLGLATLVSCIGIISVILIFKDFWLLGRPVTLSPIEVAKAFNAPIVQTHDSNATINEILQYAGKRPIQYGAIPNQMPMSATGQGPSQYGYGNNKMMPMRVAEDGNTSDMVIVDEVPRRRLQLADPSEAEPIQIHERYGG